MKDRDGQAESSRAVRGTGSAGAWVELDRAKFFESRSRSREIARPMQERRNRSFEVDLGRSEWRVRDRIWILRADGFEEYGRETRDRVPLRAPPASLPLAVRVDDDVHGLIRRASLACCAIEFTVELLGARETGTLGVRCRLSRSSDLFETRDLRISSKLESENSINEGSRDDVPRERTSSSRTASESSDVAGSSSAISSDAAGEWTSSGGACDTTI